MQGTYPGLKAGRGDGCWSARPRAVDVAGMFLPRGRVAGKQRLRAACPLEHPAFCAARARGPPSTAESLSPTTNCT